MNGRGLNNISNVGPNGPIDYTPAFILPKGYNGACHLHKDIVLFKTIDELIKHNHDRHDIRRVYVL